MKKLGVRAGLKNLAHVAAATCFWATAGTVDILLAVPIWWRSDDPVGFAKACATVAANPWTLTEPAIINAVSIIWFSGLALAVLAGLTRFKMPLPSALFCSFMLSAVTALVCGWSFSAFWLGACALILLSGIALVIAWRRELKAEVRAEMASE